MEDTLWEEHCHKGYSLCQGLNPCFNGRYSLSYDECHHLSENAMS